MRQDSHRVSQVCDKSGDWTLTRTTRRRLDGYRLYSASRVQIRSEKEAGGRRLRRRARQLRRRRDLAQGDRYPARADQGLGRMPRRSAAAGQGPASDARVAPATGLRARLWLCRLQRRRAGGGRCDPQALGGQGSDRGAGPGVAAYAVAVRECRGGARVALDGGCATPTLFTFLEAQAVEYVVAMASNTRLEKRARRLMGKARMRSKATGRTEHLYGETRYAAKTWKRKRRVIIKAEVVRHPGRDPKNNPRFLVTNLPHAPQTVYEEIYCRRGDVENRLKELHHGLEMDRTSCSKFLANQFRVLLALAAYILFQELRRRAGKTACADAQVTTLRERLIKLAVWVERSARRIVLHLPLTFPWLPTWRHLARAVGATS